MVCRWGWDSEKYRDCTDMLADKNHTPIACLINIPGFSDMLHTCYNTMPSMFALCLSKRAFFPGICASAHDYPPTPMRPRLEISWAIMTWQYIVHDTCWTLDTGTNLSNPRQVRPSYQTYMKGAYYSSSSDEPLYCIYPIYQRGGFLYLSIMSIRPTWSIRHLVPLYDQETR